MYRITGLLDDDDCRAVVAATCDFATQCRRRITWPVATGVPLGNLPPEKTDTSPAPDELPILCLEACNLLVAAARAHIKKKRSAGS
jgi:sirohydrochlorin cobaltochelatase